MEEPLESSEEFLEKDSETKQSSSEHQEYEFPLFTYLMHFVHRQGKAGDYARIALIHCVEVSTDMVSQYIIENSGFIQVIIDGLNAFYKQLPKDVDSEDVEDAKANSTFASLTTLLEFCQNIRRKADPFLSKAILTQIQTSFLKGTLYSGRYSTCTSR